MIIGQDPYHGEGQADGLAFSTPLARFPPTLKNILAEATGESADGDSPAKVSGDLTGWAKQGVLLLNTALSVQANLPLSHRNWGWSGCLEKVLDCVNDLERPVVFMLWGKEAGGIKRRIRRGDFLILQTSHPSPLSVWRGFRGCGHFRKANLWLVSQGLETIDWSS